MLTTKSVRVLALALPIYAEGLQALAQGRDFYAVLLFAVLEKANYMPSTAAVFVLFAEKVTNQEAAHATKSINKYEETKAL